MQNHRRSLRSRGLYGEEGEVSESEARELKKILEEKGLDFFGERKGDDYYYREAVKHWESLRKTAEKRAR